MLTALFTGEKLVDNHNKLKITNPLLFCNPSPASTPLTGKSVPMPSWTCHPYPTAWSTPEKPCVWVWALVGERFSSYDNTLLQLKSEQPREQDGGVWDLEHQESHPQGIGEWTRW